MSDDEVPSTQEDAAPLEIESTDTAAADGSEAADLVPERQSRIASLFTPKGSPAITDPELRERMRTLDPLERKWGFAGAAIALIVSTILVPSLLHNTKETVTALPDKDGKCSKPFNLIGGKSPVCRTVLVHHPSEFVPRFLLIVVVGLVLLYAVWKSKRVLVIVASLITGFFLGLLGLLFFIYGGWLVVRSWRLQRYGATDAATVREVVKERSEEKREAKKAAAVAPPTTGKAAPPPSKRYTPKSKPRKR